MNSLFVRSVLCSPWLSYVYFQTSLPSSIVNLQWFHYFLRETKLIFSWQIPSELPQSLQVSLSSTSTKIIVGELLKPFFILQRVNTYHSNSQADNNKKSQRYADRYPDRQAQKNSNFFLLPWHVPKMKTWRKVSRTTRTAKHPWSILPPRLSWWIIIIHRVFTDFGLTSFFLPSPPLNFLQVFYSSFSSCLLLKKILLSFLFFFVWLSPLSASLHHSKIPAPGPTRR